MTYFDLEKILSKRNIVLTFDKDVGANKPSKELWDATLARLGKEKSDWLYIDDIEKYVTASQALGIKSVHVDITQPNFQEKCVTDVAKAIGFKF